MAFPESIPLRREPEGATSIPATELAWLGVFVLLIALLALVWRKHRSMRQTGASTNHTGVLGQWLAKAQRPGSAAEVVSSVRLTPQHSVHEVQWRGRRLLIGCAPQAVSVLANEAYSGVDSSSHGLHAAEEDRP